MAAAITDPAMQRRLRELSVRAVDAEGRPVPGAELEIEQLGHGIGIGCIAFDLPGSGLDPERPDGDPRDARADVPTPLDQMWLDLFNQATIPFYWRWYEAEKGRPGGQRQHRTAAFLREHGVRTKGHPLLWHTLAPPWLMDEDDAEVERLIRERISREVAGFAGQIDQWDAINETVILPVFEAEENAVTRLAQARGRMHVIRTAFEAAREADEDVRLVLNDFDLSPAYEAVIEECLAEGIRIDAIGLQTHMHKGFRGEEQLQDVLERFRRFGLPLQFTETSLVSGEIMPGHIVDLNDYQVDSWPSTPQGEERQAEEILRHYRTVLADPAVESLTYWGMSDRGAWLGAPIGLVRADGTPKPSYEALKQLVTEDWWLSRQVLGTDEQGTAVVDALPGEYRVRLRGQEHVVQLGEDGAELTLTLS